ncbi:hypothetical protein C8Q76DRAFT_665743 [Earliella scabrosa]|nr:hypothetical protein C8Q76DRAFT_665743 [Earliella scabrosa]
MAKVFCDAFFPPLPPTSSYKRPTENPFEPLAKADELLEDTLTKKFIAVVNDNGLIPGLKLLYCGDRPDPAIVDKERKKPDAAFYRDANAPSDGKPHWGSQLMPVEFKRKSTTNLDPYDDDAKSDRVVPAESDERKKVNGQNITYVECLMAVQHRLAVFMLFVIGRRFRLIRWDRSGSIVTRAVDYYVEWELFCDILWRISQCSDVQLGCDPTAELILPDDPDWKRMDRAAKPRQWHIRHAERQLQDYEIPMKNKSDKKRHPQWIFIQEKFAASLHKDWPRYRLKVPAGDGMRCFAVCRPIFRAKGLTGRGTRGYIALDCETRRFVWLKDSWRAHYLNVEKEGDVLAQLNAANVSHVPTLICHGDIEDQVTLTPSWWEQQHPRSTSSAAKAVPVDSARSVGSSSSSSLKRKRREDDDGRDANQESSEEPSATETDPAFRSDCPLRLHRHYRLVVKEIALPLSEFACGRQLVEIVRDCIKAHREATQKTQILHRDVSGGNIMILPIMEERDDGFYVKLVGMLTDWELSKPLNGPGSRGIRQPERTGTWQFMSVALLTRRKPVEICDELEAFLYVIIYYASRYLKSEHDGDTIAAFLDAFFDTYTLNSGRYTCGPAKREAIQNGQLTIDAGTTLQFTNPMDRLLATLLGWFKAHTIVTTYELKQAERRKTHAHTSPLPPTLPSALTSATAPSSSGLQPAIQLKPSNVLDLLCDAHVSVPSTQDYALSALLINQTTMEDLLTAVLTLQEWTTTDKVGDRIPVGWKIADKLYGPTVKSTMTQVSVNKKAKRSQVESSEPAGLVTLVKVTPRAPVTPPRTRASAVDEEEEKEE